MLIYNYNGDKKIYSLQTWTINTRIQDPNTTVFLLQSILNNSEYVGENVMPPYWMFTYVKLSTDKMIALFSNPSMGITAKVITDGLGNNYQYVRPDEAPFYMNNYKRVR